MNDPPKDVSVSPLAVSLEGALMRSDLLLEAASRFATRGPGCAARLLAWLTVGRSTWRQELAAASDLDPKALPYNDAVLAWLKQLHGQGQSIVLVTNCPQRLAQQVAAHVGVFDSIIAAEELQPAGGSRRDALVARFGEEGFEYLGHGTADLPVWSASSRAHVVTDSAGLRELAAAAASLGRTFSIGATGSLRALLKGMRIHQWTKNLLIFVPLVASHLYGDWNALVDAGIAFLAFGLTASAVYLLNDLADVADDRLHPRKRSRPLASGDLGLARAWLAWPALLVLSFALAVAFLPPLFTGALLLYLGVTVAYSLGLKRMPMLDVITLAGLYTLRILAGGAAIEVPPTFWLLAFSMFMFLSLAFIKRFSELKDAQAGGSLERIRGRGYAPQDLEQIANLGSAAGYNAVLVLALFVHETQTQEYYSHPEVIWLACPLLLYWLSRAWLIAHRGEMHDDPIVFALRDWKSWVIFTLMALVVALARVLP